jgi:hypothetical protein
MPNSFVERIATAPYLLTDLRLPQAPKIGEAGILQLSREKASTHTAKIEISPFIGHPREEL